MRFNREKTEVTLNVREIREILESLSNPNEDMDLVNGLYITDVINTLGLQEEDNE